MSRFDALLVAARGYDLASQGNINARITAKAGLAGDQIVEESEQVLQRSGDDFHRALDDYIDERVDARIATPTR